MSCFTTGELVDERMDRVLTQYRESPLLLHLIRTYLQAVEDLAAQVCDLPEKFDLDYAVGDQLTLLGKRLGWPRCHCICETQPYFGFDCEGVISDYVVSGFCDENVTWVDCGGSGIGQVCINDDELYRRFLKVRRRQFTGAFDLESLATAVVELFGATGTVLDAGNGRVVITPGRDLLESELAVLQLYPRILPVALGVEVRFHFGEPEVFGFGEGWGGFCEPWADEVALTIENGSTIVDENEALITTGVMTRGAPWMCEINVRPYDC